MTDSIDDAIEEVWALDAICLRAPDGGPLDLRAHRADLANSLHRSLITTVRRADALVAYAYAWPLGEDRWFVGGLAIHPGRRNANVTAELFARFGRLLRDAGVVELHSHVRLGNDLSVRLHRRLGFTESQRNARAIAFVARIEDLAPVPGTRTRNHANRP
jgi:GNAT superfamily N-acetyltransferase